MTTTLNTNASYSVKEWFEDKIANEVGRNILDCSVFDILKETEKAVYAMMSLGPMERKCMWIPKSVLVEKEVGENEYGGYNHPTYFEADYDTAVQMFKDHWRDYI